MKTTTDYRAQWENDGWRDHTRWFDTEAEAAAVLLSRKNKGDSRQWIQKMVVTWQAFSPSEKEHK